MTRKRLYSVTALVVSIYLLALAAGIVIRIIFPDDQQGHTSQVYGTYKDLIPFIIAIPAAWLGFCFQRRTSYLSALRAFWDDLIPTVQQAIQYTYLQKPTEEVFAATMRDLSTVIDSLRGVFRNIPTEDPVGLYPYENLKDIRMVISWLGYSNDHSDHDRYWARRCIVTLWASMHQAMLLEFDREIPVYPLSKYLDRRLSVADKLKEGKLTEKDFEEEMRRQRELLNTQWSGRPIA
jgi:hypothetical protein